jgi:tellurite methyltransferase
MAEPYFIDWSEYYGVMLERPRHPHYDNLDPHMPAGGDALDLGCGVGQGVVYLVEKGFRVTAVDAEQEALDILKSRLPEGAPVKLTCSPFQDLKWSGPDGLSTYDLVVAHFSLWFVPSVEDYKRVWNHVVDAVRPAGILSVQLLGVNDSWVERGYHLHDRAAVERMLQPFDVLYFEEVDRDGETAQKVPKHWHVFHIVARKK